MGLMEFLRQWQGSRVAAGVVASVVLHVALIALAVGIRLPGQRYDVKRGEPLIVELPKADASPPPGLGGALPSVPRSVRATPSTKQRPWSPPAPSVAAKPAAPRVPADPPAAPPPPQPQPEPQRVASAVVTKSPDGEVPVQPPVPAMPEAAPTTEGAPTEPAPRPTAERPAERQVAALPPAAPPGRPDALTALRRSGGAGGSGESRAGIEGEPIQLDSKDPRYSDYLDQVRRRIKEKWGFPCVKHEVTHQCEYKTTHLLVEFGIAKDGHVPFVIVRRSSGYPIYDDYAVNAVKLASPFPRIPDSFSKTGVPIHATFSYMVDTSLTNVLR
jgi:protein TonB